MKIRTGFCLAFFLFLLAGLPGWADAQYGIMIHADNNIYHKYTRFLDAVQTTDKGYIGICDTIGTGRCVARFSQSGTYLWSKTVSLAERITSTSDNGCYVSWYDASQGTSGLNVVRMDSLGNVVWWNRYSGTFDSPYLVDMKEGPNNTIHIVCGHSYLQIQSSGVVAVAKTFTVYVPYGLASTRDGGAVIVGVNTTLQPPNPAYAWMTRLGATGNVIRNRLYWYSGAPNTNWEQFRSVTQLVDGNIVVGGSAYGLWTSSMGTPAMIVKTDSLGIPIAKREFYGPCTGGQAYSYPMNVEKCLDGGFYIFGYCKSTFPTWYEFGKKVDTNNTMADVCMYMGIGNAAGYNKRYPLSARSTIDSGVVYTGGPLYDWSPNPLRGVGVLGKLIRSRCCTSVSDPYANPNFLQAGAGTLIYGNGGNSFSNYVPTVIPVAGGFANEASPFLVGCISCLTLPVASTFTYSNAGNIFTFNSTNDPSGVTNYSWDFGDGATSIQPDPVHVYSTNGCFWAHLTTSTTCGTYTDSILIPVNPPVLNLNASSNSPLPPGATLQLSCANVPGATYSWTGPNGFASSSQNDSIVNITLANQGTYYVSVTLSGCTTTDTVVVSMTASIAGTMRHPNLTSTIRTTTATLSGASSASMVTGLDGQYLFTVSPTTNVTVTPSKSNDSIVSNGITTLDIVLIKRHILQQDTLDSPYKIIAADVNGSNTVTTLDILFIQSLILGNTTSFPGGNLWKFVDANYTFPDSLNPWGYPSSRNYPSASNYSNQDFIGCKLGDVNWSWNPAIAKTATTGEVVVQIQGKEVSAGEEIMVPIVLKSDETLSGYQMGLSWDPEVLTLLEVMSANTVPEFGMHESAEGKLRVSWHEPQGGSRHFTAGSKLFLLKMKVNGTAGESTALAVEESGFAAEAYTGNLEVWGIRQEAHPFRISEGGSTAAPGGNSIDIYPNPNDGSFSLEFNSAVRGRMEICVVDIFGRVVHCEIKTAEKGMNQWELDLGKLSSGIYLLKISAGEREFSSSFVVE